MKQPLGGVTGGGYGYNSGGGGGAGSKGQTYVGTPNWVYREMQTIPPGHQQLQEEMQKRQEEMARQLREQFAPKPERDPLLQEVIEVLTHQNTQLLNETQLLREQLVEAEKAKAALEERLYKALDLAHEVMKSHGSKKDTEG